LRFVRWPQQWSCHWQGGSGPATRKSLVQATGIAQYAGTYSSHGTQIVGGVERKNPCLTIWARRQARTTPWEVWVLYRALRRPCSAATGFAPLARTLSSPGTTSVVAAAQHDLPMVLAPALMRRQAHLLLAPHRRCLRRRHWHYRQLAAHRDSRKRLLAIHRGPRQP